MTPAHLARLLEPYRRALAARPLYISLDKDVLTGSHAAGNWDSGHLTFREVQHVMRAFVGASQGLAGMDVFGDWSACATHGLLRSSVRITLHRELPEPIAVLLCLVGGFLSLSSLQADIDGGAAIGGIVAAGAG